MLRENLERVRERMEEARERSGRKAEDIALVLVTKTIPKEAVLEAVSLGIKDIGESRVQEAEAKIGEIGHAAPLAWHMIGHLQTNKVSRAVEIFDLIQSVDSKKILQAIDRQAGQIGKVQKCLVEIKLADDPAKTGLGEDELEDFCRASKSHKNIEIGGIMMIAPFFNTEENPRPYFARARKIFERLFLEKSGPWSGRPGAVLSMGMSGDFEAAIEEGSTMVRIGSAIFGVRPAQK